MAKKLGGTLVSPPINLTEVQPHFGDHKRFPKVLELLSILKHGVPVSTEDSKTDLEKSLPYGNHKTIQNHMPLVWEKLAEDIVRDNCIVLGKAAAPEIEGLRVAPLGAVVTSKVRIINDFSFDPNTARGKKGGLNNDTVTVPRCLCAEALSKLLIELLRLRVKFLDKIILMSKADATNAFRNVHISPEHAQKCYYVVDDVLVADLRLTFGCAGSPGLGGIMSQAAEHSHCHTSIRTAEILPEGADMMSHVKVVETWEVGDPIRVPEMVNVKPADGGDLEDDFFACVYVDDFLLARVQLDPSDQTAFI